MAMFQAIDTAASGVRLGKTWMDVIAHNLANLNNATRTSEEPFRAQLVLAQSESQTGEPLGVRVVDIVRHQGEPPLVYAPNHPLADEDGLVQMAVVDMGAQMTDLIMAQRTYQVNLSVVKSSQEAYQSALQIGRAR